MLGPILFNIFMNDLFYLLENDLHNFSDDNTVSAVSETVPELINSLTLKSNLAINWFQTNSVIVNPDKFKAIILTKTNKTPLQYNQPQKPLYYLRIFSQPARCHN